MIAVLKRNMRLYFRNRAGLMFSLLAVIMTIFVCLVFLENSFVSDVLKSAPQMEEADAQWLVRCWVLAGLLSVTPVTTSVGALGPLVFDRESKSIKDFKSAPLSKSAYPLAITIGGGLIGLLMTLLLFAAFTGYIALTSGHLFSLSQLLRSLGITLLTSLTACCLNGWVLSHFSTESAFANYSTLLGTNIGFFNAIYLPVGTLPVFLRFMPKVFPFGSAAAMQRDILLEAPMAKLFAGAPEEMLSQFRQFFGVELTVGGTRLTTEMMIGYLLLVSVVTFLLFMRNYNARQEQY